MFEASSAVHWIALVGTVLSFVIVGAVTYGVLVTRLRVAEKTIEDLCRGRESQGQRIGIVEERQAHTEGHLGLGIGGRPKDLKD